MYNSSLLSVSKRFSIILSLLKENKAFYNLIAVAIILGIFVLL